MPPSSSKDKWIEEQIAALLAKYGSVPPPWFMFPDTHPYDVGWRMGAGESHLIVFGAWWQEAKQKFDETQRIDYFRRWPPPPRWLTWMMDVIWDLEPMDMADPEAFDYSPYFAHTEKLGFGSQAEYDQDINDSRWFESK